MKRLLPLFLCALAASAIAQQPQPQPPGPDQDPISRQLFPPELIMAHQDELNLQDRQRTALRTEVVKLQSKVVDLQWQLSEDAEKLSSMLKSPPIDEAKALEQADRVMSTEREIKRLHLGMLIRIKNLMTPEQVAKLQEMRNRR